MYLKIIFFIFSFLFFSCEKDPVNNNTLSNNYGNGTYILTDNGLSFIKKNSTNIEDLVFQSVNGSMIQTPKSLLIYGSKLYIIGQDFYASDINTLELLGKVAGFSNASGCAIITKNRAFVCDKDESLVKLIDLNFYEITSEIETGINTSPSFIINKGNKSFILNSGNDQMNDSTIVTITYKDNLIPLSDFSGNIILGKNPNSAILTGNVKVLCSGIYDVNDPSLNTESSYYVIDPNDLSILSSKTFAGIYNANNFLQDNSRDNFYFSAIGGIYIYNRITSSINLLNSIDTDLMRINYSEEYVINDSTTSFSDMIYMNDLNNLGRVYKYNTTSEEFVDTIVFNGNVLDIAFKL